MRRFLPFLISLLILIAFVLAVYYSLPRRSSNVNQGIGGSAPTKIIPSDLYPVTKIIDGDTIVIVLNGRDTTVRLIGADTPEIVDPRRPVECFGLQSSDYVSSLLSNRVVRLESDPTQGDIDSFGRLLRYVFLEDGTNLNHLLIEQGYAHEYTYRTPYRYQSEFKSAEALARSQNRGLWNPQVCTPNN